MEDFPPPEGCYMITRRQVLDAMKVDKRLSASARETLRVLVERWWQEDGTVQPVIRQLADQLDMSESTVNNRIYRLEHRGYLRFIEKLPTQQRIFEMAVPGDVAGEQSLGSRVDKVEVGFDQLVARVEELERQMALVQRVESIGGQIRAQQQSGESSK